MKKLRLEKKKEEDPGHAEIGISPGKVKGESLHYEES